MKKILFKMLAITLIAVFICTTAFAAEIKTSKVRNFLVVTISGLENGEESTLLVLKEGTEFNGMLSIFLDPAKLASIFYVNQTTATNNKAVHTFKIEDAGNIEVYSGYSSMTSDDPMLFKAVDEICVDNNNDHYCDSCEGKLTSCKDENNDHLCDICEAELSTCKDDNNDHNCDICGDALSECDVCFC